MADKDFVERDVLRAAFPDVFCIYASFMFSAHSGMKLQLKSIGSPLSKGPDAILKILQVLLYSVSQDQYDANYRELSKTGTDDILAYYNSNWHPIKHEWAFWATSQHQNLLNRTNNRVDR